MALLVTAVSGAIPVSADEEGLSAQARAVASGRPVEVPSMRTETDTVRVNPDGTYTREIASEPIRVRTSTGWTDVNYELRRRADGTVAPLAAPGRVELSGGGAVAPLTKQTVDGVTTSFAWPDALPVPSLDGNAATYSDVFPGVDLVMTVAEAGVSQVLVVENADAAKNPELRRITVGADVDGGSLHAAAGGGLEVRDEFGRPVAQAARPLMWDSSGAVLTTDGASASDTSDAAIDARSREPVNGDSVAAVPVAVGHDNIALSPEAKALTGPGVDYPVYIDPKLTANSYKWAMIFRENPTMSFYKWQDGIGQGVGYQTYSGVSTKRLMWQFSIHGIAGAEVDSAQFKARMIWSASCTKTTTILNRISNVTSSTNWGNQPGWGAQQDSVTDAAGRDDCNPSGKDEEFDVTDAATSVAASGETYLAFEMHAQNETSTLSWKRFNHAASLEIVYNHRPSVPASPKVGTIGCAGQPIGRTDHQPSLSATITDPDGDNMKATFSYWGTGIAYANRRDVTPKAAFASGARATSGAIGIPTDENGVLHSGTYFFRVKATDDTDGGAKDLAGAPTADCKFTIDARLPGTPSIATSAADNGWTLGVGQAVSLSPAVASDGVTAYRWKLSSQTTTNTSTAAADGTATISVKPATVGVHVLSVWAVDAAGNQSGDPATLRFETNDVDLPTRSIYSFDIVKDSAKSATIADEGTPAKAMILTSADLPKLAGRYEAGSATRDDRYLPFLKAGTARGIAPASGTGALAAGKSFTISARLDPAEQSRAMTAVTYGDSSRAWAKLGVDASGAYTFSVWDKSAAAYRVVTSPVRADAEPGFDLVVASYLESSHQLSISVVADGDTVWSTSVTPDEPADFVSSVTGAGHLVVGAGDTPGAGVEGWTGAVDQVEIGQGWAGSPTALKNIYERSQRTWTCSTIDDEIGAC